VPANCRGRAKISGMNRTNILPERPPFCPTSSAFQGTELAIGPKPRLEGLVFLMRREMPSSPDPRQRHSTFNFVNFEFRPAPRPFFFPNEKLHNRAIGGDLANHHVWV